MKRIAIIMGFIMVSQLDLLCYAEKNSMSIIPVPRQIETKTGEFRLKSSTKIVLHQTIDSSLDLGRYLAEMILRELNLSVPVGELPDDNHDAILMKLDKTKTGLGDEGYELLIEESRIEIVALRPAGLFYGIQTLRQMMSVSSEASLPCVFIQDTPQYPWRGLLLDCARHFMDLDFLKRAIDLIAYHKLNRLHLHLTDDQGWRIESKKYPELTRVGAFRKEGDGQYGGFYTQDQLRELVDYAQQRFITIIPEFEMPGHASAAVASYPELSCQGKAIPVETEWGIFPTVFCPGKESTFEFLEGVLDEIVDIFPSTYIHIGGDEAPRERWEECPHCQQRMKDCGFQSENQLQGYLIERIARYLAGKNRQLIGWDEILEVGELPKSATVQSWRGMAGAVEAGRLGHKVISSSNEFVYFDYGQDERQAKEKPDWMMLTSLEKVYQFQPIPPELTPEQGKQVLGAECALWTEHSPQEQVDAQLFPRLCAFSEVAWSAPDQRDFVDFKKRMEAHYLRLDQLGVKYFRR